MPLSVLTISRIEFSSCDVVFIPTCALSMNTLRSTVVNNNFVFKI